MPRLFKKRYTIRTQQKRWPRQFILFVGIVVVLLLLAMVGVRQFYYANLEPVSGSSEVAEFTIEPGMLTSDIAEGLHEQGLIRRADVFQWYVKTKNAGDKILAGTYSLQPSFSTPQIVAIITQGKVSIDLVTVLPGQRIDEIKQSLANNGFADEAIEAAFNPAHYADHPALVDKPKGASLEGYLYPESFQRTATTTPEDIVRASLDEMSEQLTPDIRSAFGRQGLSVYEGIILASIVEQETHNQEDRKQVAQVFLKRMDIGMRLDSDPTAHYGAEIAGQEPSVDYSSPYNTYEHAGLPPTPISNVTETSLQAVAQPADTDWLFFVAGDDGTTHFSKTLDEHERLTEQYCTTLCGN